MLSPCQTERRTPEKQHSGSEIQDAIPHIMVAFFCLLLFLQAINILLIDDHQNAMIFFQC